MPPSSYKPPTAAKPSRSIFDPFNSSATGHQRADNRLSGSTSWRDSRTIKLRAQYTGGTGRGKRVSDSVGAGSLDFGEDGRTENGGFVPGAKGLRDINQRSLWEVPSGVSVDDDETEERASKRVKLETKEKPTKTVNPYAPFRREDGKIRESSWTSHESSPSHLLSPIDPQSSNSTSAPDETLQVETQVSPTDDTAKSQTPAAPQIFRNLTFYINGSTAPIISDHKLKHLLASHGANHSISLGRRSVTHVLLSKPGRDGGCGGGLTGSKLHKEITKMRGESVKFVTVEWVLESIKAGKRLPEGRFEAVKLASKGQSSVANMFGKSKAKSEEAGKVT